MGNRDQSSSDEEEMPQSLIAKLPKKSKKVKRRPVDDEVEFAKKSKKRPMRESDDETGSPRRRKRPVEEEVSSDDDDSEDEIDMIGEIPKKRFKKSMPPMPSAKKLNRLIVNDVAQIALGNERAFCDYRGELKPIQECIDENLHQELRSDLNEIRNMNLLDDDEFMDALFMQSPAFDSPEFLRAALSYSYRTKYENLLRKYESLNTWLEFHIWYLIGHSEEKLKSIANTGVNQPRCGKQITNHFATNFKVKRLGTRDAGGSKVAEIVSKHPFASLPIVKQRPRLFNLGGCVDYDVPSEFASLFMDVYLGSVSKYTSAGSTLYNGIKVSFNRPILTLLSSREHKGSIITYFGDMKGARELLIRCTNLKMYGDTFAFGKMKTLKMTNLRTKENEQNVTFKEKGYIMNILTTMICIPTSNNQMDIRSYSNTVYHIETDDIDEHILNKCSDINESKAAELEKILEEYEESKSGKIETV